MRHFRNAQSTSKLAAAAVCLALLIWLLTDRSSLTHRSLAVASALKAGTIGSLSVERLSWFTSAANSAWQASGVSVPLAINRPWRPGVLNIYTTTPLASAITHCDRGNAVYDRELDSIFIDTALFDTADFSTFLSNTAYGSVVSLSDLPFLRTYLQFLLLHEIGHRQLHRSRGSIFDSGRHTMAAEREREADDFAFDKLTAKDKSEGDDRAVDQAAANLFDLDLSKLSPADVVATDLAAMVVGMNLSFLFIPNPYAPYYADDAHQTFVARSRSLIHSALKGSSEAGRSKSLLQTVDQLLQREESATQNDTTEIIFPEPLADVTFDGSGIRATSVQFLKTYSVPLTLSGTGPLPGRGNKFHSVWAGQGQASPTAVDDWWKVSLWTTSEGQTFAWCRDGTIYVLRKGRWEHQDLGPWNTAVGLGENEVFLPAQPSTSILVGAKISDNSYRYSVVQASGLVASRKESDIMEEIARRGGVRPKSLKPLLVTDESAFVAIQDVNQAVWGVAQLNMRSLGVLNLSALRLPPGSAAIDAKNALAVIPQPQARYYLFSSAGAEGDSKGWAVWRISEDRDPALLLQVPYFAGNGDGAGPFGGVSLEGATWISDDRLLVAIGNDSLYELDVTAKGATPVFHPGDEIVKKRIARNGTIAVFVQGGFKCYLIRPHR